MWRYSKPPSPSGSMNVSGRSSPIAAARRMNRSPSTGRSSPADRRVRFRRFQRLDVEHEGVAARCRRSGANRRSDRSPTSRSVFGTPSVVGHGSSGCRRPDPRVDELLGELHRRPVLSGEVHHQCPRHVALGDQPQARRSRRSCSRRGRSRSGLDPVRTNQPSPQLSPSNSGSGHETAGCCIARTDASLSTLVPSAAVPPRRCIWANASRSSIVVLIVAPAGPAARLISHFGATVAGAVAFADVADGEAVHHHVAGEEQRVLGAERFEEPLGDRLLVRHPGEHLDRPGRARRSRCCSTTTSRPAR